MPSAGLTAALGLLHNLSWMMFFVSRDSLHGFFGCGSASLRLLFLEGVVVG